MISKVRLLGWSRGLKKVALTKLIREAADVPLDKAHEMVNQLLAGKTVEVRVSSDEEAHKFVDAAQDLGADAKFAGTKVTARK